MKGLSSKLDPTAFTVDVCEVLPSSSSSPSVSPKSALPGLPPPVPTKAVAPHSTLRSHARSKREKCDISKNEAYVLVVSDIDSGVGFKEHVVRSPNGCADGYRDTIVRAEWFLTENARRLKTISDRGVVVDENFSQLLILDATHNASLVDDIRHSEGKFHFFRAEMKLIVTASFPFDLDTTSLGLSVVPNITDELRNRVMDEMLTYRNRDGIIQTYFDHTRPRIDPVVCANVLALFFRYGRGHEQKLAPTVNWVEQCLIHSACTHGSRYYATEEQFFFFIARLLNTLSSAPMSRSGPSATAAAQLYTRLAPLLRTRILNKFGAHGDALCIAMRIYAAASVGLVDSVDLERLRSTQEKDGSWTDSWYYKFPSVGQMAGNVGVTTAVAVEALKLAREVMVPEGNGHTGDTTE